MYCVACGAQVADGQNFCPACGKSVTGSLQANYAPSVPPGVGYPNTPFLRPSRVEGNVRLLGILWMAYSALHLIPGLFLILFFGEMRDHFPPEMPSFVPLLVQTIGFALTAVSLVGFLAGWGLIERKPWARMLAIVFGVLSLFNLPFGTAIGVYTLWVLLPAESEQEYQRIAMANAHGL